MSDLNLCRWEVWHARFNFQEGKGYKYRPVIVLASDGRDQLVMMVTSATNKLHLENDYRLVDWAQAGLDKPSIARVDRIAQIPASYLGTAGRIGRLSERDALALAGILRKVASEAR
ncbi:MULTISPECIES: type II toxin-antitoxin system PemK/MazF family toxin [Olsenella]|uniref:type II toxin-antitoxin system PemK/MazF family toxin n=1 Tax=Olsenella TaxID=133925 RepID=UPI000783AF98|nr:MULTISPECIES: type II toxin-antitoxin system PemK/MazF family toxin [Olsenella]KXB63252.1 hypothetical protein HMPREF1868_00785 [Olsenella sp. DNF00959]